MLAYAKEQKPSLWVKAQPAFLGAQGKTILDPDFDIDDGGLPHESRLYRAAEQPRVAPQMVVNAVRRRRASRTRATSP